MNNKTPYSGRIFFAFRVRFFVSLRFRQCSGSTVSTIKSSTLIVMPSSSWSDFSCIVRTSTNSLKWFLPIWWDNFGRDVESPITPRGIPCNKDATRRSCVRLRYPSGTGFQGLRVPHVCLRYRRCSTLKAWINVTPTKFPVAFLFNVFIDSAGNGPTEISTIRVSYCLQINNRITVCYLAILYFSIARCAS